MPDNLSTIRQVIEQHRLITQQVGRVGGSVNDMEALFALQRAHSNWAQSSVVALSEKEKQLNETVGLLDARLRSHFAFEEKALPPILGEVLMKALVLVHRGIAADMDKVKAVALTSNTPSPISSTEMSNVPPPRS